MKVHENILSNFIMKGRICNVAQIVEQNWPRRADLLDWQRLLRDCIHKNNPHIHNLFYKSGQGAEIQPQSEVKFVTNRLWFDEG